MRNKILALIFWILVWQIISMVVGQEILIVSPVLVVKNLINLIPTTDFWNTVLFSFSRIVLGFISGVLVALILVYFSYKNKIVRELLKPLMSVIKSTPVVSFIILALIWISSTNLSILISFLMVLPIIYIGVLEGVLNTNNKMLEMAQIFSVKWYKKFKYIYLPATMPIFVSVCSVGLGFCWKSGIAAEVIGKPTGSIGEKIYRAKLFLNTGELFAWTIVIIIISMIFEKTFMKLIKILEERWRYN